LLIVEVYSREEIYADLGPFEVMQKVCITQEKYPIPPLAPPPIGNLLEKCWAFKPTDRPQLSQVLETLELVFELAKEAEAQQNIVEQNNNSTQV
jgi:hypothetical protein